MKIELTGKIGKATIKNLLDEIDLEAVKNDNEQTVITSKAIYEISYDNEDDKLIIRKYAYTEYANAYGAGTLEDLKERLS